MACAAMVIGGVMLNPPRADFASPVRAYETTTASRMFLSLDEMFLVIPSTGQGQGRLLSDFALRTDQSAFSTLQNTGVAGPSSTALICLRQALGTVYWPRGM